MNEKILNSLTTSTKISNVFAYLTDEANKEVYAFLFNPESKKFSRQANYSDAPTALTSLPAQQYNYTTGRTLELSNLILESYNSNKTCKELITKLENLMIADVKKGQIRPTPVTFKWGSDSFGLAVITSLNWVETSWLDDGVASARVNLTLLEIPAPFKGANTSSVQAAFEKKTRSTSNLTEREKQEASNKAREWLKSNFKTLPDSIIYLFRSNKYKLATDNAGNVTLLSDKNKLLGTIGNYKNGKFTTTNNNLRQKR